jgi:hypothetical protein
MNSTNEKLALSGVKTEVLDKLGCPKAVAIILLQHPYVGNSRATVRISHS